MFDFLNEKDRQPPALPEGTGWVENEDDGSVTLEVQGDPALFLKLFALIQRSDYIQITSLRQRDLAPDPWERDFRVRGCW